MPLEIPLLIGGLLLMQGFFFVRRIDREVIVTWLGGVHLRARNPLGYWLWRVYYFLSLIFIFILCVGIVIGLSG